jgi:DNA/RNA endonuclease G (NUC1)
MKPTPEAELKKYSKILEYFIQNPEKKQTAIKKLEVKIKYLEEQVRNKKAYNKVKRAENYKLKKEETNEAIN